MGENGARTVTYVFCLDVAIFNALKNNCEIEQTKKTAALIITLNPGHSSSAPPFRQTIFTMCSFLG